MGSNPIIPPLPAGLLGKAQECEEKFVFVGGLLSCLSTSYVLAGVFADVYEHAFRRTA